MGFYSTNKGKKYMKIRIKEKIFLGCDRNIGQTKLLGT